MADYTDLEIRKESARLIRRVRAAYKKLEEWESIHDRRSKELGIFMMRFAHRIPRSKRGEK